MYKIIFDDNTEFQGGDFQDSKWNDMSDLPIKKLEYNLGNKVVILSNFQAYNHVIEKIKALNIPNTIISKIMIMGRKGDKVFVLEIDIINKKINKRFHNFGMEYMDRPTTGWKRGVENHYPDFQVLDI